MASTGTGVANDRRVAPVVCVDLDGTLIATDLLWESLLQLLRQNPLAIFLVPIWLLRGRAYLKCRLASCTKLKVELLPYRQEVLEYLQELRARGSSRIVLATASFRSVADEVARHLNIFDEVVATEGELNLKGEAKAEALKQKFGSDFLYIGDNRSDISVWKEARQGGVVGSSVLHRRASHVTDVVHFTHVEKASLADYWRALRPHHWNKNVLLALPLLLAHRTDMLPWLKTLFGIFEFGLAASAIYVLNDLLDLTSDRKHPWKQRRPFASSVLSIPTGLAMASLLLVASVVPSWIFLGPRFGATVAAYCALSLSYSLYFKRKALVDVFVLASFYVVRILAGAQITRTPLSHWFLTFSLFFFFSLSLAKRYSELIHAGELADTGHSGHGYRADDARIISIFGVASAFAAILLFTLYTASPEIRILYPHPAPLILICPLLLYWMMRIWLRAERGELNEDPVTLAMRDPVSWLVVLGCLTSILLCFLKF